jgi:hypothetical protein
VARRLVQPPLRSRLLPPLLSPNECQFIPQTIHSKVRNEEWPLRVRRDSASPFAFACFLRSVTCLSDRFSVVLLWRLPFCRTVRCVARTAAAALPLCRLSVCSLPYHYSSLPVASEDSPARYLGRRSMRSARCARASAGTALLPSLSLRSPPCPLPLSSVFLFATDLFRHLRPSLPLSRPLTTALNSPLNKQNLLLIARPLTHPLHCLSVAQSDERRVCGFHCRVLRR